MCIFLMYLAIRSQFHTAQNWLPKVSDSGSHIKLLDSLDITPN